MQWFFWALSSAFFAGVTALLAKIGVSGLNSNLATAIRTSVILIFTWAIVFMTSGSIDVQSISRKTWIFLVLSGVATGLSWLCYFRALQIGGVIKGCTGRQAKRGHGHGLWSPVSARAPDGSRRDRRILHRRRCPDSGLEVSCEMRVVCS
jgi:hypothetical protein